MDMNREPTPEEQAKIFVDFCREERAKLYPPGTKFVVKSEKKTTFCGVPMTEVGYEAKVPGEG